MDYLNIITWIAANLPVKNFRLIEPKTNFTLCIFNTVTSVADITSNVKAKVTTRANRERDEESLSGRRHGWAAKGQVSASNARQIRAHADRRARNAHRADEGQEGQGAEGA